MSDPKEKRDMTVSRRNFLGATGAMTLLGAGAVSGRTAFASVPEAPTMTEAVISRRSCRKPGRTTTPSSL